MRISTPSFLPDMESGPAPPCAERDDFMQSQIQDRVEGRGDTVVRGLLEQDSIVGAISERGACLSAGRGLGPRGRVHLDPLTDRADRVEGT